SLCFPFYPSLSLSLWSPTRLASQQYNQDTNAGGGWCGRHEEHYKEGFLMDHSAEKGADLTSNIAEVELDRPAYLPTTADCLKWAPDGRLAVNLGSIALVYQPRFEGRERYGFTACSVPCPEMDSTIVDLQRFPGKAGDFMEFAKKGLKYLTADNPNHLEKCLVGGDSSTISSISWSPKGCAWDGGCLLSVVTSLHAVTVFQPARESKCDMEWEPVGAVSTALLEWGLRVCPTDGAKTYTECLKLRGSSSSSTTTTSKSSNENNTSQMDRSEKRAGGKGGAGFGGGGSGSDSFRFPGLWAVARAARTSTSAWMDRRVVHRGHGRRRRGLAAAGDVDGCSSGGGGVPVGAGGGAFTLLALAGEFFITLWAFSDDATAGSAGAERKEEEEGEEEQEGGEEEERWSYRLSGESPAWVGDLRALGSEARDGNVRALAWCHERPCSVSRPPPPPPPSSSPNKNKKRCPSSSTSPSSSFSSLAGQQQQQQQQQDYLAIGTCTGAVLLLKVDIDIGSYGASSYGVGGSAGGGGGGGFGDQAPARKNTKEAFCMPGTGVRAVPFRRVCVSDGSPVTYLTFVVLGEGRGARGELSACPVGGEEEEEEGGGDGASTWCSSPRSALAVAKGASVSLFPSITDAETEASPGGERQRSAAGPPAGPSPGPSVGEPSGDLPEVSSPSEVKAAKAAKRKKSGKAKAVKVEKAAETVEVENVVETARAAKAAKVVAAAETERAAKAARTAKAVAKVAKPAKTTKSAEKAKAAKAAEAAAKAGEAAEGAGKGAKAAAVASKAAAVAKEAAREAAIEAAAQGAEEEAAGGGAAEEDAPLSPLPFSYFPAAPHRQQPAAITWRAHDHNVTGISTVPFSGPVSSTALSPSPDSDAAAAAAAAAAVGSGVSRKGGMEKAGGGREGARGGTAGPAVVGGKRRRQEERDVSSGVGATREKNVSTALLYTCSADGSCKEWEVVAVAPEAPEEEGREAEREKEVVKARLRKTVSGDPRRASSLPLSKPPPPLLGCSASPNGVLVAFLEFCRSERSTRKAFQDIARKGTHCRVVFAPMVPAATARAATAEGGRDSSWNFPQARGALSTDWAWYLRAAALEDVAVDSGRKDVGSFSLIPTLRRAIEGALEAAATAATTTDDGRGSPGVARAQSRPFCKKTATATTAAAAGAPTTARGEAGRNNSLAKSSGSGGGSGGGGGGGGGGDSCSRSSSESSGRGLSNGARPSVLLWDLLRLHHLFLATVASVARCQASVHVPPVADFGDPPGEDCDSDSDDDDDDSDSDDDGDGGSGSETGGGSPSDAGDDEAGGTGKAAAATGSRGGGSRAGRRSNKGKGRGLLEDDGEEKKEGGGGDGDRDGDGEGGRSSPAKQQPTIPKNYSRRFSGNNSSRSKRARNETGFEKEAASAMSTVKKIQRLRDAAERVSAGELAVRASAAESAARNRLVLIRALELLKASSPSTSGAGPRATGATKENKKKAAAAAAAAPGVAQGSTGVVVSNGGGSVRAGGNRAASTGASQQQQQQQQQPVVAGVTATASATQRRALAAERCLREACRLLARSRFEDTGAGAGGGFLAGPLATPVIDLPREADVRAVLRLPAVGGEGEDENKFGKGGGGHDGGHGSPRRARAAAEAGAATATATAGAMGGSFPPFLSDEACLLCGAAMLSECDAAAAAAAATAAAAAAAAAVAAAASNVSLDAVGATSGGNSPGREEGSPPKLDGGGGGGGTSDGKGGDGPARGGGNNAETTPAASAAAPAPASSPLLYFPGWAVCSRGHRVRRCMDTLSPALGVGFRRCEVCRCVLVSPYSDEDGDGGGGDGWAAERGGVPRGRERRSACVFCNILLASEGSAVSWQG
ncbi:unnamed protein product, partial [Pylaiella littoralis]